ncbi:sodium/hydrogen exchanger 10-like [Colossoma macropomum]|uniref:sodium/hydrogen exchanger 10-like n=1 Tax=Colossoma macropomum TaxID=42526 RepID=UPI001864ED5E|nr:sodium/hydrogen exchanger 10-like [Colossoma macropomum]
MMFGAIVSTLDPFVTVSQLHSLGTAKPLILITEGESLFVDGTAFITFEVFKDLATHLSFIDASYFTLKLVLKVLGSPLIGFIMSKIVTFWLSHIFDDGLVEITISLAMTYITFYLAAQWLGMSGVIAVLIMGLLLDTVTFSPEIEVFLLRFWEMLTYLANTLIFFVIGIVIAQAFQNMAFSDFLYILSLYCAVQAIRLVTVVLLSPLLSRCGYGFNYRWALVCFWGATKGAFCLSLTLMAYQAEGLDKFQVREKILVLSSGMVLLTLIVNATTMNMCLKVIGMCDILEPKRLAMNSALLRMKENAQSTLNMLKGDRFLADANWEMVNIEEFSPSARVTKCPDCDSSVRLAPSPRELDDMMEAARVRILTALKESYWKQYSSGMLNREATRILIDTAEIMTDHKGKFMTVQDIKKYWEPKGFLIALQKKLEDWLYNVNIEKLSPSRSAVQKLCCQIVFSVPFESVIYVLILLNIFPIIIEFVPVSSDEYSQELHVGLAMRKAYILNPWNQFDLFIIVLAVVDIVINDCVASFKVQMIRIVRVSKMFRLTRVLRLIKIIIPKLITLVEHQIHKQLSLGYDIGKGYILGEEDISKIIDHIADDQTVSKKLKGILEMNRQVAVKEIGLLQRNHPEIAISVKTRQAARAVLNSKRETIKSLMLLGLLDEVESKKLKKMIEIRMKKLTKFPPTIPAPTPGNLLQNVPWLHSDVAQIEFIKKVAKLMIFDFGDIIMHENDKPQGIHLIVSGVVKGLAKAS